MVGAAVGGVDVLLRPRLAVVEWHTMPHFDEYCNSWHCHQVAHFEVLLDADAGRVIFQYLDVDAVRSLSRFSASLSAVSTPTVAHRRAIASLHPSMPWRPPGPVCLLLTSLSACVHYSSTAE